MVFQLPSIPNFTADVSISSTDVHNSMGYYSKPFSDRAIVTFQTKKQCKQRSGCCTGFLLDRTCSVELDGNEQKCDGLVQFPYIKICTDPITGEKEVLKECRLCND